jgi:hypothetical protein
VSWREREKDCMCTGVDAGAGILARSRMKPNKLACFVEEHLRAHNHTNVWKARNTTNCAQTCVRGTCTRQPNRGHRKEKHSPGLQLARSPPRLSMICRWCSSFHSSAKCTLRSSAPARGAGRQRQMQMQLCDPRHAMGACLQHNQCRFDNEHTAHTSPWHSAMLQCASSKQPHYSTVLAQRVLAHSCTSCGQT